MKAIVLVDCQQDFFPPNGALAVPESDTIRPVLAKITKMAKEDNIPIIKTMDCHDTNDPEFKVFPPHCVEGTEGQASIVECAANKAVVFNKKTYDVFHNELGSQEIDGWLKKNKITEVWVAGVCTEICVLATVKGLCKRGITTYVFQNAIHYLKKEDGEKAIKEMKEFGAHFAVAKL